VDRASYENAALVQEYALCPEHVPEVLRFDDSRALIIMRYVEPPHLILRKVLIAKQRCDSFAPHLAIFAARTLFGTSCIALPGADLREAVCKWSRNSAMCALTEQVIFTDPYYPAQFNHWEHVSPHLDNVIRNGIYRDSELQIAVAGLKEKFLTQTQALLHGDLHSGSVMVAVAADGGTEGSTFVIDPEFAFYGPAGFDTGLLVANLLLSYCSHCFQNSAARDGEISGYDYSEWILSQLIQFDRLFEAEFIRLWSEHATGSGEVFHRNVFGTGDEYASVLLRSAQKDFMSRLWRDTMGFAGAEMIRRIVGIAHVADLESSDNTSIAGGGRLGGSVDEEKNMRARCSYFALVLGRRLIMASMSRINGDIINMHGLTVEVNVLRSKITELADYASFNWP
jgi:5-methylthioribose kinase